VWLNRQQMSVLFDRDVKTIGKHINNALKEELAHHSTIPDFATVQQNSVVAIFATTAVDGKIYQVEHYNLDVILSVGYRVKSNRGIQFRAWANRVLKEYLLRGYAVNQRIDRLERKIVEHDQKFDLLIKTALPPREGVFYDGQIFDAYIFVSDLIKAATQTIVLFDNYVDETVLLLLSKRQRKVSATVYTKRISSQLQLDLDKHNAQYKPITITKSEHFHDRFLIIDNGVYHIGASLKDLGKKLFAFSKMEMKATELLKNNLKK
jgi:transposase-like protein